MEVTPHRSDAKREVAGEEEQVSSRDQTSPFYQSKLQPDRVWDGLKLVRTAQRSFFLQWADFVKGLSNKSHHRRVKKEFELVENPISAYGEFLGDKTITDTIQDENRSTFPKLGIKAFQGKIAVEQATDALKFNYSRGQVITIAALEEKIYNHENSVFQQYPKEARNK